MMKKNVLITGASGAIGSAIAKAFAKEGATLFLHGHKRSERQKALEQALKISGAHAQFFIADLTVERAVSKMTDAVLAKNDIDIFVHCVSLPIGHTDLAEKSLKNFQDHFNVQAGSFFTIVKRITGGMKKKKAGTIIPILSEVVIGHPPAGNADYVTAKYALLGLAKALASEYGRFGITCVGVSPGLVDTPLTAYMPKTMKELAAKKMPGGKLVTPEDVAREVVLLCRGNAAGMNGQNIVVHGGARIR